LRVQKIMQGALLICGIYPNCESRFLRRPRSDMVRNLTKSPGRVINSSGRFI